MDIGFVGLGAMGQVIVLRLLATSDVTFSIVTNGAAVKAVALGENGVLSGMRTGGVSLRRMAI